MIIQPFQPLLHIPHPSFQIPHSSFQILHLHFTFHFSFPFHIPHLCPLHPHRHLLRRLYRHSMPRTHRGHRALYVSSSHLVTSRHISPHLHIPSLHPLTLPLPPSLLLSPPLLPVSPHSSSSLPLPDAPRLLSPRPPSPLSSPRLHLASPTLSAPFRSSPPQPVPS